MHQVPHNETYPNLLADISRGQIKIPQFQRDFVWTKERSARLLDSILKGYPIGAFILWKTKESLRTVRNIGSVNLPDPEEGDFVYYILDGQQRITSLYVALKGLTVPRKDRKDNFSELYINLNVDPNFDNQIVSTEPPHGEINKEFLKVTDLLNSDFRFLSSFPERHHEKLQKYKNQFEAYTFSLITVKDASIDVATEIFSRINVGATPLSVFEIMVAKTFDENRNFDLAERYDNLIDSLQSVNYETISPAVVLQTVSAVLVKACDKKHILRLNKQRFIDVWDDVVNAIYSAIDHFRDCYSAKVSRLLPYTHLVIPFSYFYFHHSQRPTGQALKRLEDFFWRTSLSARYSHSVESKIAQDLKRIDAMLNNQDPEYEYGINIESEFIRANGWFSATRSFVKAMLCLMASYEPKSFADKSAVRINNDWLQRANSKNYHHFFPRAVLRNQVEDWLANHIGNITIVDDKLNKHRIRARKPSSYMREFADENQDLVSVMKSHLIELDDDGIWTDDYERFLSNRCARLSIEISKRIIPREIDQIGQKVHIDDFEEDVEVND